MYGLGAVLDLSLWAAALLLNPTVGRVPGTTSSYFQQLGDKAVHIQLPVCHFVATRLGPEWEKGRKCIGPQLGLESCSCLRQQTLSMPRH